ncbi:CDP-alcohol phosphatidyltransferase family protein [Pedococcus sp. 5OH_020]|uniref:CDP-alcohol phosphatidyltransferase family protein n=1 Tax=Pedococcus sp. 5OH_020 TaxID=2989814 RepID=UPI0022E9CC29|nr:CDP-alcohol phosphatidyltransferase family protein [Pedococcus sp. 5OH_020]
MRKWIFTRAVPWLRHRMFRTGIDLDAPIVVHERVLTWANVITLLRLIGLPLFAYLALARQAWFGSCLVLSTVSFLDSIDGYVARRFNQVTKLGSMMDHVVDRATVAVAALTLLAAKVIPVSVVVLLLTRDVLLFAMVTVVGQFGRPLPTGRVPVSKTGKLATMALLVSLPFLILDRSATFGSSIVHIGALALIGIGLILYYVSLGQYVYAMLSVPAGRQQVTSRSA